MSANVCQSPINYFLKNSNCGRNRFTHWKIEVKYTHAAFSWGYADKLPTMALMEHSFVDFFHYLRIKQVKDKTGHVLQNHPTQSRPSMGMGLSLGGPMGMGPMVVPLSAVQRGGKDMPSDVSGEIGLDHGGGGPQSVRGQPKLIYLAVDGVCVCVFKMEILNNVKHR